MMSLFRKEEEEGLGSGVLELERLSNEGIQESFENKKCFQENGRMEYERVQGEEEGIGMIMPVSPAFTMETSFAARLDSSMAVPMCDLCVDTTLPDSALNLQVRSGGLIQFWIWSGTKKKFVGQEGGSLCTLSTSAQEMQRERKICRDE
jgi:hypothetical protein